LEQLNEVAQWIEPYRKSWEERFTKMDDLLARLQKENGSTNKK
jgi:hypothetical protein